MKTNTSDVDPQRRKTPPGIGTSNANTISRSTNFSTFGNLVQRVPYTGNNLQTSDIQALQRSVGNRAVDQLLRQSSPLPPTIQPKRLVSQRQNRFEEEANQVKNTINSTSESTPTATLQRQSTKSSLQISQTDAPQSIQPSRIKNSFSKFKNLFGKKSKQTEKDKPEEDKNEFDQPSDTWHDDVSEGSSSTSGQESFLPNTVAPDWENPHLINEKPTRYVFTIAVARQNPEYLTFAKERAKITLRNQLRAKLINKLPKIRAAKSSAQIKEKAARVTVNKRGALPEDQSTQTEIAKIIAASNRVGHTWVKFTTYVGDDMQAFYSFGFYPEKGYAHPQRPVAGIVEHPDHLHESATDEDRIDDRHIVKAKSFNKGLEKAEEIRQKKPQYTLAGFNCTSFAKHIASIVGAGFPSAGTVFPAEPAKGFFQILQNPNKLYESLEGQLGTSKGNRTISSESEGYSQMPKGQQKIYATDYQLAQQGFLSELENAIPCEVSERKAIFFEGKLPGDGEYIMSLGDRYDLEIYATSTTPTTYRNPEEDLKEQAFLPCLVRYSGSTTIRHGWIRADHLTLSSSESEGETTESSQTGYNYDDYY